MNKVSILLKGLLLSTSQWNIYKNCKDKKKKGRIVGNTIGMVILFIALIGYCIAQCVGYGMYGLTDSIPVMCAIVVSTLGFVLTFLKTNGYLFNFKEYDMLMALPFKPGEVAMCKFFYMYIKSLPWYMSVSLSMMAAYGVYTEATFLTYVVWVILSFVLPLLPMVAATFIGFIIAKVGSGFKNKTMVQTVVTFIFIFAIFGLRFFIEKMFRTDKTAEVVQTVSEKTEQAGKIYFPVKWFAGAVNDMNLLYILLLIVISIAVSAVVFMIVGRSYKKINSALKSHAASNSFVMGERKTRSVIGTLVFKEFRRMTGSTTCMTNALLGQVMCLIAGIAVIFVNVDDLLEKILMGAPLTKEMLSPAIPFVVYFFVGMVATTAFTPSLEGKNYWILQSLPITKKTMYQGKMLYNMLLTVPFAVFATITFSISMGSSLLSSLLSIILVTLLCAFSTAWGCVCGVKHMRLDWENEVEVIKQGAAVAIYLFPNMLSTMALIVLTVFLGTFLNKDLILLILIVIVAVLAGFSYNMVLKLSKEQAP